MKEEPKSNGGAAGSVAASAPVASSSGGMKAWLPLLINLLLMPVIAYGVVTFVLLPKLKSAGLSAGEHAKTTTAAKAPNEPGKSSEHGAKAEETKASGEPVKVTVSLSTKVMVNVANTAGAHFLLVSISLEGSEPGLKLQIEKNDVPLRDAAANILGVKTMADLEKLGAKNIIRAELIAAFNAILGVGHVEKVFLPEFAVQ